MKREIDNIDKDVAAAQALGYGVHYGRYKADYPNTKEPEPEQEPLPKGVGACLYCGTLFDKSGIRSRKLYCSDECRTKYGNRKHGKLRTSRAAI